MATTSANPLASGVTAELYRAAIGPRGQDYYLRQFARFDAAGKTGTSWHWPAYWTTFNWLVYRRMWGWALAYAGALLGLVFVIFGVGKLVFDYSDATALLLFLLLLTAAFVLPGLYANAWFYTYCNEQISAVLRSSADVNDARKVLEQRASTDRRWLALALANAVVLAGAVGVAKVVLEQDKAPPLLAAREERPLAGGQSGLTRPLSRVPAVAASAPASVPLAVASAVTAAPAAVASAAAAPAAPRLAAEPAVSQPVLTPVTPSTPAVTAAARPAAQVRDKASAPRRGEAAPTVKVASRDQPAVAVAPPAAPAATPPRVTPASAPVAAPRPVPRVSYVWVVQVGAFAQDANAQKVRAQVEALGLETGADAFESAAGRLTRVRVGPFTRRAEAEQAALRIKSLDLPVLVIRQRP